MFQSMQRGSERVAALEPRLPVLGDERSSTSPASRTAFRRAQLCAATRRTGGFRTGPASEAMLRSAGFEIEAHPEEEVFICRRASAPRRALRRRLSGAQGRAAMIEAAMIWNEPNNKSHWDFEFDPGLGGVRAHGPPRRPGDRRREPPACRACSGGISPIDPDFMRLMAAQGVLRDRGRGRSPRLPARLESLADRRLAGEAREIRAVTRPAGVGLRGGRLDVRRGGGAGVGPAAHRRTADRASAAHPLVQPLRPARRMARDDAAQRGGGLVLLPSLPHGPARRARHGRSAPRGTSPNSPPPSGSASGSISRTTGSTTRCAGCSDLGVRYLRTGLSWADCYRPDAEAWFDRQMRALEPVRRHRHVLLHARGPGTWAHHTAPPGTRSIRRILRPR